MMRLRNYLILAPFAGECCSHPSPATEPLESTPELFPAVMSLHYANHLVLGTYFSGLTAAKLSGSAVIMDAQGSNTLFSQQKWGFFLFWEHFSGLCQMLVGLFRERVRAIEKVSLSILGILKQTKGNS